MDVLLYVLIAGILACLFAMFVVAARGSGPSLKNLPGLDAAPLLDKKEADLAADLEAIAGKLRLKLMIKPSLGSVVQAKDQTLRAAWRAALAVDYVDFVLADPKNHKPLLAVLPSGEGRGDSRHPVVVRALDGASVPYLAIGNYNLAGLEKAVKEKVGDLPDTGRRGRTRAQQQAEGASFPESPAEPEAGSSETAAS